MKKMILAIILLPALAIGFTYKNNAQTGKPDLVTTSVTDITDISSTFVPYSSATRNVKLGSKTINTAAMNITGTAGNGYLKLTAQSSNPASPAAGTLLLHPTTVNGFTRMEQDNEAATNLIYSRDNVFIAKNTSGGTINAGQPVYVTGSTGNVPNIGLARANSTTTLPALGVALDSIGNNNFGQIMKLGIISNINTSAYSTGDTLWVSTSSAGALQNTRPTYPNFVQRIGTVLVSGVGNGSILVTVAPFIGGMESGTNVAFQSASTITGTQLVSNIATGTAPLSVTSTTPVTNLSIGGNAGTATTLQTARTIFGISFNGSANIYTSKTVTDNSATPDVTNTSVLFVNYSTPVTITNFTGGVEGQIIRVVQLSANNFSIDRSNAYLQGSTTYTSTQRDVITLLLTGGVWYEVSRSGNNG